MPNLSALSVVVADDNPNMREIVSAILKAAGIEHIRQAADGWETVAHLRAAPADLAIVDLNMRPLNGVGFTRMIRHDRHSPNPYLPILMMTGHAERAWVMEARDAGVTEFIVKPFTPKALLSRIESMVLRPRPFVKATDYFGPCRRRGRPGDPDGPKRRASDRAEVPPGARAG